MAGRLRVAPLEPEDLDAEQREALGPMLESSDLAQAVQGKRPINLFLTLARAPAALKSLLAWTDYILSPRNALSPRLRELAILRVAWNCRSAYEFGHHRRIALQSGVTEAEVEAVKAAADAPCWNETEQAILFACDELHRDSHITDATWSALESLGEKAQMDLVMTVGQYTQVAMMLNAFGVTLEEGEYREPELIG